MKEDNVENALAIITSALDLEPKSSEAQDLRAAAEKEIRCAGLPERRLAARGAEAHASLEQLEHEDWPAGGFPVVADKRRTGRGCDPFGLPVPRG